MTRSKIDFAFTAKTYSAEGALVIVYGDTIIKSEAPRRILVQIPRKGVCLWYPTFYYTDNSVGNTGRKVTNKEMQFVHIKRNAFHGEWNYEIHPAKLIRKR